MTQEYMKIAGLDASGNVYRTGDFENASIQLERALGQLVPLLQKTGRPQWPFGFPLGTDAEKYFLARAC
jgi:hypothetical protein